jgi:hypothetical protein
LCGYDFHITCAGYDLTLRDILFSVRQSLARYQSSEFNYKGNHLSVPPEEAGA